MTQLVTQSGLYEQALAQRRGSRATPDRMTTQFNSASDLASQGDPLAPGEARNNSYNPFRTVATNQSSGGSPMLGKRGGAGSGLRER